MQFRQHFLDLSRPRVMGILNVTPDSFSDGGQFATIERALRQAQQMIEDGADFIDVGGESTRPGAAEVSASQELDRVIPVIERLSDAFDTVISIDTSKAVVMREAVNAGAGLINDVRALQSDGALQAAADSGAAVCLMHMQGQPRTMQHNPQYADVVSEVREFLQARKAACVAAGIPTEQILFDPGFGFGKTLAHNYQLLAELPNVSDGSTPLLVGMSRKSMIGNLLGRDVNERLAGSLATATIAALKGAQIIRVHDVRETVDAVKVVCALDAEKEQ